jgi:ATP-dependent DNA ligase
LVILGVDGRLSFDALQQRLARARAKAAELPASFAAFDLLAANGIDLRTQRWTVRRQRLERLARDWVPPLQLTPVTADLDEATEWFEVLPAALGVEGLVVKGAATRYTPGRRDAWVKVNSVGVGVVRSAASPGLAWSRRIFGKAPRERQLSRILWRLSQRAGQSSSAGRVKRRK